MENPYDQLTITVGHEYLFHTRLTLEEVIEIISRYPTSLWLDLFSKIESFLVIQRKDLDPQIYLAEGLFPPSTLSRTRRKTKDRIAYFSLGQINLLRKFAIAYGTTDNIAEIPKLEISKALLAAHDLHNEYDDSMAKGGDLESFAKFIIRNGYLNGTTDFLSLLTRTHGIYIDQAKKLPLYPSVTFTDFFTERVGLDPEDALALSFALATPFFQNKELLWGQTTIINPRNYFEKTLVDSGKIDSIIESLATDFLKMKENVLKELKNFDPSTIPTGYSLGVFRKAPLIRLSNGNLVCSNLSCLLEKATQNVIWMPLTGVKEDEKGRIVNDLTNYRGNLFGEYVKELCSVFENKNKKIFFLYIPPESTKDSEEVGDSILIQGDKLVVIEAKSRQFNEAFKSTGEWEKDKLFLGLIEKAASQIEIAARKIKSGKVGNFPSEPLNIKRIYPVIVTYENLPMHGKILRFIRQKIREAGLLTDPIFAPVEILNIDDFERLTDVADTFTLIDLLDAKNIVNPHASETSFHNFFANFFNTNRTISNGWLKVKSETIWNEIVKKLKFKETLL
jgi:hypothetical protein